MLVLTVDLSDLSFRTQSLAFEHQALWGPSDNRLGIFSSFFPHNLKIKVSAMKYFPLEMHQHACEHPPEMLCKVVKAPPVRGILKTHGIRVLPHGRLDDRVPRVARGDTTTSIEWQCVQSQVNLILELVPDPGSLILPATSG